MRITVIKFGVNDLGGSGTGCCEIEVRADTAKLTYLITAEFGEKDRRNFVIKGEVFIKDAAKVLG